MTISCSLEERAVGRSKNPGAIANRKPFEVEVFAYISAKIRGGGLIVPPDPVLSALENVCQVLTDKIMRHCSHRISPRFYVL